MLVFNHPVTDGTLALYNHLGEKLGTEWVNGLGFYSTSSVPVVYEA